MEMDRYQRCIFNLIPCGRHRALPAPERQVRRGTMIKPLVEFIRVGKSFPLYHSLNASFKSFLLGLPESLIKFRLERFVALEDISFGVHAGETVGLIGKNGSGKSTTLGLIAGVLEPSTGQVIVRERVSPLLELGGGFHPDLTGRENVLLKGVLLGLSRKLVSGKTDEILKFAELLSFADQPIRTYSSGMLARLGFSIITQLNPKLLLVDEVLAVGDVRFKEKCYEVIEDFKKKGVTILLVSHNPYEIRRLCDRAIWVDNHRIRDDGPVGRVLGGYMNAMKRCGPK